MKDVPPPRCGCEGRASTTRLHSNGTVGVVVIASSVVWRAAADRPCRARSAETALNGAGPPAVREQPRSGDGRRTSAVGSTCYAYRNADPAVQSHDCADCNFHSTNRPASDPFPSSERNREHTVRRPYPSNTCHTPPAPPRCSNGNGRRAMNGQRPNAVNRATLPDASPAAPNGWNARGNAHPCLRRAGGISIFTLQLSFLGH